MGSGRHDKREGEERSPLNASDPRNEAVTKRVSLCAALVSLNHERFHIVPGEVGSGGGGGSGGWGDSPTPKKPLMSQQVDQRGLWREMT